MKGTYWILTVMSLTFSSTLGLLVKQDSTTQGRNSRILEEEMDRFLEETEPQFFEKCHKNVQAMWNFETNVTSANMDAFNESQKEFSQFQQDLLERIHKRFPVEGDKNKSYKLKQTLRTFTLDELKNFRNNFLRKEGDISDGEDSRNGNYSWTTLSSIYGQATVCAYRDDYKCNLRLNPDLENILKDSRDFDELEYYWTAWHNVMGQAISAKEYGDLVEEDNEFVKSLGYDNVAEFIGEDYSSESPEWTFSELQKDLEDLMDQLRPFYMTLHAFVRVKLKAFYGNKYSTHFDKEDGQGGYIPVHILGNMWAQDWTSIENITKPYPNVENDDVTNAFKDKNYTVESLVDVANDFFKSIGLLPMNAAFLDRSILERPKDNREMVCHATAYDLCYKTQNSPDEGDYRIKMCGQVDAEYFEIIHHEMGHIEYYMQYSHLPFSYREAANPGFHEAIGDTIALAASSPRHLHCDLGIDLGRDVDCSRVKGQGCEVNTVLTERDINSLFRKALLKLPQTFFAYSMVIWKWEVETGKISPEQYNDRWWEIRRESQGIVPPGPRPSGAFDPVAKYHIVSNIEYIRYFWSSILQFQLFQGMCTAVGEFTEERSHEKPLYQCDLAGNKEAGKLLGEMLRLGSSVPWPDALELVTGSRKLSLRPFINYFQPLFNVLEEQLEAFEKD